MTRQKVVGLTLILAGVAIPLLLLLASSGYDRKASLITNILNLNIVLRNPGASRTDGPDSVTGEIARHGPGKERHGLLGSKITLPYRFPLAVCVFLVFLGIRRLDQSRGKSDSGP